MAIIPPYAAVCFFRRQAGRPDSRNRLESGESELICLHGVLRLCRLARDIESGRGILRIKSVNPVTLSNRLFTLSELKILIFPIHEVWDKWKEGGGGNQNSGL